MNEWDKEMLRRQKMALNKKLVELLFLAVLFGGCAFIFSR
jgi:hypothetical protein